MSQDSGRHRSRRGLQPLANLALAHGRAPKPQHRDDALLVVDERGEWPRVSGESAAALTAAEQAGSDDEGSGTRRVVDEASTFYRADNEITGATGNSPRPGW